MDWDLLPWQEELLDATRELTSIRREHAVLRQREFFTGVRNHADGSVDLSWFGADGAPMAGRWADHAALAGPTRTVAIQAASIGAFGALWLLQFAILDRVLFADRTVVGQDSRIPIPSR